MAGSLIPSPGERAGGFEDNAQRAYVETITAEAQAIANSIPDPSHLSNEQAAFLSRYCGGHYGQSWVASEDLVPLYREDIIDSGFATSVTEFSKALPRIGDRYEWYVPFHQAAEDSSAPHLSRRLEVVYLTYMSQRRRFHAAFMEATLESGDPAPIKELLVGFEHLQAPFYKNLVRGEASPLPEFMYNVTNWAATSLISALMLSPDSCNAQMKRHAVELFAALARPEDFQQPEPRLVGRHPLYGIFFNSVAEERGLIRLSWSMRVTDEELRNATHPQWRENEIYLNYFGPMHNENANGLSTFLNDYPKDYVQVLLLRLYNGRRPIDSFQELRATAHLAPEIKDIIFAEDASFNTLYLSQEYSPAEHQLGLSELLTRDLKVSRDALSQIVNQQGLQLQSLTGRLAAAHQIIGTILAANMATGGRSGERRTPLEILQERHGIAATADDDMCLIFIRSLRQLYAERHHPTHGRQPDETLYSRLNQELDLILESRDLSDDYASGPRQIEGPTPKT